MVHDEKASWKTPQKMPLQLESSEGKGVFAVYGGSVG